MRLIKKLWLSVFFLLIASSLSARELPFKVGDRLIYELEIFGIKAGTQIDEVIAKETKKEQPTYHFRSNIATKGFASLFYKVSDKIDCWVGTKDLLPIIVLKDIQQGRHKKYYDLRFDHQKHQAVIVRGKDRSVVDIPAKTFDPLSLIYYLRARKLKVGDTYKLGVLSTTHPKKVAIQVVSEEKITCPYGKFDTFRVEQKPSGTIVWFAKNNQRLPVKIEVATKVGKLRANLVAVKHKTKKKMDSQ